jgi:predicted  nucleic acid-binding Zn-ribbon protein
VEPESGDERPRLTAVESVRCLECGAIYAKPAGGGTVHQNPGCPECGYVGWVGVNATPFAGSQTPRFAEDRLRHQGG